MMKRRALEVACGGCHVTRHVLLKYFEEIELMDRAHEAVKEANQLRLQNGNKIVAVHQASMEAFSPDTFFNCIVLRYCIGYLSDDEAAVEFLHKMGKMLDAEHRQRSRAAASKSFIFLQDNIQGENMNEVIVEG